jgi:hypothetical protein
MVVTSTSAVDIERQRLLAVARVMNNKKRQESKKKEEEEEVRINDGMVLLRNIVD